MLLILCGVSGQHCCCESNESVRVYGWLKRPNTSPLHSMLIRELVFCSGMHRFDETELGKNRSTVLCRVAYRSAVGGVHEKQ